MSPKERNVVIEPGDRVKAHTYFMNCVTEVIADGERAYAILWGPDPDPNEAALAMEFAAVRTEFEREIDDLRHGVGLPRQLEEMQAQLTERDRRIAHLTAALEGLGYKGSSPE